MEESSAPGVFSSLWRYKWSSLLIVVLAIAISAAASLASGTQSVATAKMALQTPTQSTTVGVNAQTEPTFVRYVNQRAIFATSNQVLAQAAQSLGNTTKEKLRKDVTATATTGGEAIVIRAKASSATRASNIANAVVQAYVQLSTQEVTDSSKKALDAIAASRKQMLATGANVSNLAVVSLDENASQIQLSTAQFGSGVSFINSATTSSASTPGLSVVNLGLGLIVGLLIAATIAWLRADRDRRVSESADVSDIIDAPLLGDVAELQDARRPALLLPTEAPDAAFQLVVSGVQGRFANGVLLVSSAAAKEGRTTTALQVATGAARDGRRVLLVDASMSAPGLSTALGFADAESGLASLLAGTSTLEQSTYEVEIAPMTKLYVLPVGQHNGRSGPRSSSLQGALEAMRASFDLIVVDSEPSVDSPETAAIARYCDRVLVVVRSGSNAVTLARYVERLRLFDAVPMGYVFNAARGGGRAPRHRTAPSLVGVSS